MFNRQYIFIHGGCSIVCQPPRRVRGLGSIAPKATLLGGEAIVQDVLVAGKVESNE